MMLKYPNSDKEAADAPIQPIYADLNDNGFEYREGDQFMDQQRNQNFPYDRSELSHLIREQQQ
jgi:hypothetical protein